MAPRQGLMSFPRSGKDISTQMDAEWPRSDPSADRAWPVQPVVGQDRPQQEQLRWTFGGFVGGILPSGLLHPQSQQTPYPLSWRKQAIAPHVATGRQPTVLQSAILDLGNEVERTASAD